ncbi:hypothetical protein [Nonomuraea mesophila]|uniref:hypothetical protein n=1 Tax=Nonomuraea mesophila TaxID=2530382 RepID=UPI00140C2055|nr:hypothetical protein [Nonomuraea mesophila]
MARLDLYQGLTREKAILQPGKGNRVNTRSRPVHPPQKWSACAGSPAGGSRFVCTRYVHIGR